MPGPSNQPALLLSLQRSGDIAREREVSRVELAKLASGLGYDVMETFTAKVSDSSPHVLSEPLRQELTERLTALTAQVEPAPVTLVVDGILSPNEHRNLEQALQVPVMDRVLVVLSVFERRARTDLSRLEVELAQLRYELPRVRDLANLGDREGGGGRGGRGHSNVELRKQQLRDRIAEVRRSIGVLRERRRDQSERRSGVPRVALVGYTNAGKSSLLEALTESTVHVEDALFATLDTTVRALRRGGVGRRILVSDTVGFMRRLPHELVASFESTLSEARTADLVVVVADASDPEWQSQLEVTRATLASLELAEIPSLLVLNKADRLTPERRTELVAEHSEALVLSVREQGGVRQLKDRLEEFFDGPETEAPLRVPFSEARTLAEVRAGARIVEECYDETGGELVVRARLKIVYGWVRALQGSRPIETVLEALAAADADDLCLSAVEPDFDEMGLDFRVVHSQDAEGRKWVLRVPRRPELLATAEREARMLSVVRSHLSVDVPRVTLPSGCLMAYPRLAGQAVVTVVDGTPRWLFEASESPPVFITSLARTLVEIQSTDVEQLRRAGTPMRSIDQVRQDLAQVMDRTRGVLSPSDALWRRWQDWLERQELWPGHVSLIHGDLHPGHLLVDEERRLVGVLDWTEAQVGDPSIDLAMVLGCFGQDVFSRVVSQFAKLGGRTWPGLEEQSAERWAAFAPLAADWALRSGQEWVLGHAREHLTAIEEGMR